jgi:hypothetical protein
MNEKEIVVFGKIVQKMIDVYEKECERMQIESAYYPVRVTIWAVDTVTLKPIRKIIETDTREVSDNETP